MYTALTITATRLAVAVITLLTSNYTICQEVVSEVPLGKDDTIATLPVFAVRKIPVDRIVRARPGS
jgi:hypothetical protein